MGWSSGSELFGSVIKAIKPRVSDEDVRCGIYKDLILAFREEDWDTEMECLGEDPAYDKALKELHPTWFD